MYPNKLGTYDDAKKYLYESAQNPENGKPLENNTRLFDRGDYLAVQFHNTDIVKVYPDSTFQLSTGGWFTRTTMERMNKYSPVHLETKNSVWRVHQGIDKEVTAYYDGIKINLDGHVISDKEDLTQKESAEREVHGMINDFVDGFIEKIKEDGVPTPDAGDCWYCVMQTEEGDTLGDATQNYEHLYSHLTEEERYYVPALLWNAVFEHRGEKQGRHVLSMQHHGVDETEHIAKSLKYYFRKRKNQLIEIFLADHDLMPRERVK